MPRPVSRGYIASTMAFVTLGLTLSTAVDARERIARTPYGQSKAAVEFIRELVAEMNQDVDGRLLDGEEGPSIDCLQSHRTTAATLQGLAEAERARLVEVQQSSVRCVVARG